MTTVEWLRALADRIEEGKYVEPPTEAIQQSGLLDPDDFGAPFTRDVIKPYIGRSFTFRLLYPDGVGRWDEWRKKSDELNQWRAEHINPLVRQYLSEMGE
jgi:hypothetical protein